MKSKKEDLYTEILECLVKYGNLSQEKSESLLLASPIYQLLDNDQDDLGILDHETPYYWAMDVLFSKERPDWYQDRKLWPPPKEYLDRMERTK